MEKERLEQLELANKKSSPAVSPKVKTIDEDSRQGRDEEIKSEKLEENIDAIKMVYGDKPTDKDKSINAEDYETKYLRKQNEFKQEQKNRKEQDTKRMMDMKETLGNLDNMGFNIGGNSLMFSDINDQSSRISSMDEFFKPLSG